MAIDLTDIRILLKQGKKALASKSLANFLLNHPDSVEGWMMMAEMLEDPQKIAYCCNRCLMVDPSHAGALALLRKIQPSSVQAPPQASTTPSRRVRPPAPKQKEQRSKYQQMLDDLDEPAKDHGFPPLRKPGSRQKKASTIPPLDFDPDTVITDLEERKREKKAARRKYYKPNWALILGILIAAVIIFLAIFGPDLAPKDPMEQNVVVKVEGEWHTPPVDPFTNGFPMGSDDLGRDILSRVLYGIRPTLLMVLSVAAIRLMIGTIIGMIAGWNRGFIGRSLDSLISAALSIPVLIVALAGIAAVGTELGVLAFIVGLSLTGWVETARIVRDQTETIRGQQYIEAALALGLTPIQTIFKHVVRQILSIIWVLFAFEISNSLMLTASLGFLGYYIGGDIWVQVSDTAAAAYSGEPELGQMLATANANILEPWGLVGVGTIVFITVLGFNLIGEGLRNLRNIQMGTRSTAWKMLVGRVQLNIDHYILYPIYNITRTRVFKVASLGAALIISGLLIYQYFAFFAPLPSVEPELPGLTAHYWAAESHDQYQTSWTNAKGPQDPEILWVFQEVSGFTGAPVVTADGLVLITSGNGILFGLDADMNLIWKIELPEITVASPALDQDGYIYLVDQNGGLLKISPEGALTWHYQPENTGSTYASPILDLEGNAYYPVNSKVTAVSADGELIYQKQIPLEGILAEQFRISPDQQYLYVKNHLIDIHSGDMIEDELLDAIDSFNVTSSGDTYLQNGSQLIPWKDASFNDHTGSRIEWEDAKNFSVTNPSETGITPHDHVWLFYGSYKANLGYATDTRMVWLTETGRTLSNFNYPTRNSLVVGVDQQDVLYSCGNKELGFGIASCQAFSFRSESAVWDIELEYGTTVNGGAIVSNRMYVSTEDGYLYAIGGDTTWDPEKIAEMQNFSSLAQADAPDSEFKYFNQEIDPIVEHILIDADGFSGGPVLDEDNNIYIASASGTLYSLQINGQINWQIETGHEITGKLSLDPQGRLVVITDNGEVFWYSTQGDLLQSMVPEEIMMVISDAVMDDNGNLYITAMHSGKGHILAVSSEGQEKWFQKMQTNHFYHSPLISSNQAYVFFNDEIFNAQSGEKLEYDLPFEVSDFFPGQDLKDYVIASETIAAIQILPNGINVSEDGVIIDILDSMGGNIFVNILPDSSILLKTRNSLMWFTAEGEYLYSNYAFDSGIYDFLAYEDDLTTYLCGFTPDSYGSRSRIYCGAMRPAETQDDEGMIWRILVEEEFQEYGGAVLVPGHIIVSSLEGILAVISDANAIDTEINNSPDIQEDEILIGPDNIGPTEGIYSLLMDIPGGFSGEFAATDEGILYIPSDQALIYVVDIPGKSYSSFPTPSIPSRQLNLADDGNIIATGSDGSLFSITPDGELNWHFTPDAARLFSSAALDPNGNIYYTYELGSNAILQAVSADGENLWSIELNGKSITSAPEITGLGNFVIVQDQVFNTLDGKEILYDLPIQVNSILVGDDGEIYIKSSNTLFQSTLSLAGITLSETSLAVDSASEFDNYVPSFITDDSVVVFTDLGSIYWYDSDGTALGYSTADTSGPGYGPFYYSFLAIDADNVVYGCGTFRLDLQEDPKALCSAFAMDEELPIWTIKPDDVGFPFGDQSGGILINGLLYLTTDEGELLVIGAEGMDMFEELK